MSYPCQHMLSAATKIYAGEAAVYLEGRARTAPNGVVVPAEHQQVLPVVLAHQKVRVTHNYRQRLSASEGDVELLRVPQEADLGLLLDTMASGQRCADNYDLFLSSLEVLHLVQQTHGGRRQVSR